MGRNYLLCYDIGTGGAKAVLVDEQFQIVESSFESYSTHHPAHDWAEQEPEEWWKAVCKTTQSLLNKTGISASEILGLGFATQMLGVVPISREGECLGRGIIWMDNRAVDQAKRLVRMAMGKRIAMALAGAVPSGKDVICKYLWIRDEEPEIFRETHRFLDVCGFLVYRCTGEMTADYSAASVTGLLNKKKYNWDNMLIKVFRLPADKLPSLKASHEIAGGITRGAAEELGLTEGTPVITGLGDAPAAAVGVGAVLDGDAYYSIGTSGLMCITVHRPKNLGKRGIVSIASAERGKFILIGETQTAGACLRWFCDNFARESEISNCEGKEELAIYEEMDELVSGENMGSGGVIFTPWLFGERAPVTDMNIRAGFYNISLETTREQMLRSIYEGVAFHARWLLDISKEAGFHVEKVRLMGGGARSDIWMQILSDVTGREIQAVENPQDAGALGAAYCVGVGLGEIQDFSQIKKSVRIRKSFNPETRAHSFYNEKYDTFLSIYDRVKGLCQCLNMCRAGESV